MKKSIIGLITLSFSSAAFSVVPLVPKDNFPELEQITPNSSWAEIGNKRAERASINSNEASVFYTYSETGFQQKGQGQTYDTKSGTGQGIFTSYTRSLVSENEVSFKLWVNQATFTEPSNIGGKDVGVQRTLLSSLYSLMHVNARQSWQLDLGATALSQNPDKFSNSEKLVPHYLAFGPTIGGGYKFQANPTWSLKSSLALTLPVLFKEYGANSGHHSLSWHYLGSLLIEAKLNRSVSFTFGVLVDGEEHRFDGEGERGVQDASVSYVSLAIPLGVRYAF